MIGCKPCFIFWEGFMLPVGCFRSFQNVPKVFTAAYCKRVFSAPQQKTEEFHSFSHLFRTRCQSENINYKNTTHNYEEINRKGSFVMRKTSRIGLIVVLALLGVSADAYAESTPSSVLSQQMGPVVKAKAVGIDWVRLCLKEYPEILWLAEEGVRVTEEGRATLQGSYSELLFGKKFIEFDRTIMTLHCLRLVLHGGEDAYQQFVKAQPKNSKLSRNSFDILHKQGLILMQSRFQGMTEWEMVQAMEAALVLGDIGKSEKARSIFKPYGAKAPDHDDFHEEVIEILQENPHLSPTFARLAQGAKELISKTANLAHYGHITHLEGGPGMFSKLQQNEAVKNCPILIPFSYFVYLFDVAGALGHVNNQSSLVYTESTHFAISEVFKSCRVLENSSKTEKDAYDTYLAVRARCLGMDIQNPTDCVLTRVGAMLRLFTVEEGAYLKQAFSRLSKAEQDQIVKQLSFIEGEELDRTPTYMPAVLVNLANNPQLAASERERLSQAVALGLPFIARVLQEHKENLRNPKADPTVPLCFNQIAGIAKKAPYALKGKFCIDSEGNVCVLSSF